MSRGREDLLLRLQKVLADFGDLALQSENLDEVLTEACRLVAAAMQTGRALVLEMAADGRSLLLRAGVGWPPHVVGHQRICMDECSSGSLSIDARRPVVSRDIAKENRLDIPQFMKDAGVRALANVPIRLPGGRAFGLLQVDARAPRDFDQDDIDFLRTYATMLGPIVDRILKLSALRASEERFRLTMEGVTDYAIMITDPDDRITDWLPGAEKVYGWSAREAIGQPGSMMLTPEDRAAGIDRQEIERARTVGLATGTHCHLRKDGSALFIEGSVRTLRDAEGRLKGFIRISQDMTLRREADVRQAFLLEFSDAIRPLADPDEIRRTATRMLGRHLKAARVAYAENVGDGEHFVMSENYVDGVAEVTGRQRYADYGGDILAHLQSGQVRVHGNIRNDPQLDAFEKEQRAAAGIGASLDVPLVKGGQLVAWLAVNYTDAHDFQPGEIELVKDVGDRTWAAMEQGRAEAAMRDSEQRLEAIFAGAPVGLAEIDLHGRFQRVNGELCRIFGRSPDQVLGSGIADVTHPQDLQRSVEAVAEALHSGGPVSLEKRYRRPDGTAVWANSTLTVLRNQDGTAERILAVTSDQTMRREAQRALRESEERLRNVLNSMTDGYAHVGPDFTILDVNQETERLDGRPRMELVGRSQWEAFPGIETSAIGDLFRRVMRERRPAALEHQYAWPDGRQRWLETRVYPMPDGGVTVFWRDISDRKRADDALRQSEQRYRTLFQSMDEAYAVVEVLKNAQGVWADIKFIEVNSAFFTHTSLPNPVGRTATEMLGTPNPRWALLLGQVLDTGEPLRVEEAERTLERVFDLNIFCLEREQNRVAVLFTNITERRAWEEHQKVLVAELQHRTRNLMGVIRSISSKTARGSADLKDFHDRFSDRLEALARVQGLLSRLNDLDRVTFDDLIRTEMSAMVGASDRVTMDGPSGIRLRSSTVQTLALAVHELATNAVKYGALGQASGRLAITWSLEPVGTDGKPWLHIDWRESGVEMPSNGALPRGTGQGRDLIERALPYQLNARTSFEMTSDGIHCTISMPVSEKSQAWGGRLVTHGESVRPH